MLELQTINSTDFKIILLQSLKYNNAKLLCAGMFQNIYCKICGHALILFHEKRYYDPTFLVAFPK